MILRICSLAFALIFLANSALASTRATLDGHGHAKFGMTEQQLKRVYPNVAARGSSGDTFQRPFQGLPDAVVVYSFRDRRLSRISIFYQPTTSNLVGRVMTCESQTMPWLEGLAASYGSPDILIPNARSDGRGWWQSASWVFQDGSKITFNATSVDGACTIRAEYQPGIGTQERF